MFLIIPVMSFKADTKTSGFKKKNNLMKDNAKCK